MKLIVGLGNPGLKYENTRHNCGFMAIDFYAGKHNLSFKSKFNGLYSKQIINNETVIVLKPQTFMNLSGECVREFINYFDIDLDDVLIIHDDVDFEIGTFKVKVKGSSWNGKRKRIKFFSFFYCVCWNNNNFSFCFNVFKFKNW